MIRMIYEPEKQKLSHTVYCLAQIKMGKHKLKINSLNKLNGQINTNDNKFSEKKWMKKFSINLDLL